MGGKLAVGLAVALVIVGFYASAAIGSHGATTQSTCIRSKQPDGTVVTQSLAVGDPTGLHCGQWICNAPTAAGVFSSPLPCVTPALKINVTTGTTVGVKPITVPGGDWTLTVYLKNLDAGTTVGPLQWEDGTDATIQRELTGSEHWQVHNMATSGADAGAFELYFGDPLSA